MKLHIIDAESIYQRLLATASAQEREAIYRQELLAPFEEMMHIYGGGNDPLAWAKMWGFYTPDDFDSDQRPIIEGMVKRLSDAGGWQQSSIALERGLAAFAPYADRIDLGTINCVVILTKHNSSMPGRGYAGFGVPGYLMVSLSLTDDYTLPRIGPASVHELNHNVRFKLVPFLPMSITVADYIIAEGLAEAFAAELFGEELVGYYVTDFNEEELTTARRVIGGALEVSGFHAVHSYIFGDTLAEASGHPRAGVPDFAGYAIGYRIVRQYLQRTRRSVAEATFLPSREIIEESGFFA
ncbi:uncharacterized protein YjaZ [Thermosporothrix hazakensis]|jgi:uncharacterized protein YjaZ|uniref:Uncharacterized protein YjaZ n=1 Tax=Thermosporothrix hazakensis TaxID=644383 RepID=A0A326US03_THEHA|nr:DUF2268 domain-containing putative Zn-dependent protease [Thermosporothrix hazakensis]PZW34257.1 uncharacterized protein YjaZ [Thermosporothrix hazakensis]GCE46192.1 hypothetical protein KTH_10610 [Thermosporothrix hazakensis]